MMLKSKDILRRIVKLFAFAVPIVALRIFINLSKKSLAFCTDLCYNGIWSDILMKICMDGFPSGQRGQTVNLLQIASVVRITLHPLASSQNIASAGVAE